MWVKLPQPQENKDQQEQLHEADMAEEEIKAIIEKLRAVANEHRNSPDNVKFNALHRVVAKHTGAFLEKYPHAKADFMQKTTSYIEILQTRGQMRQRKMDLMGKVEEQANKTRELLRTRGIRTGLRDDIQQFAESLETYLENLHKADAAVDEDTMLPLLSYRQASTMLRSYEEEVQIDLDEKGAGVEVSRNHNASKPRTSGHSSNNGSSSGCVKTIEKKLQRISQLGDTDDMSLVKWAREVWGFLKGIRDMDQEDSNISSAIENGLRDKMGDREAGVTTTEPWDMVEEVYAKNPKQGRRAAALFAASQYKAGRNTKLSDVLTAVRKQQELIDIASHDKLRNWSLPVMTDVFLKEHMLRTIESGDPRWFFLHNDSQKLIDACTEIDIMNLGGQQRNILEDAEQSSFSYINRTPLGSKNEVGRDPIPRPMMTGPRPFAQPENRYPRQEKVRGECWRTNCKYEKPHLFDNCTQWRKEEAQAKDDELTALKQQLAEFKRGSSPPRHAMDGQTRKQNWYITTRPTSVTPLSMDQDEQVDRRPRPRQVVKRRGEENAEEKRENKRPRDGPIKCYNCDMLGHMARDCPNQRKTNYRTRR